MLVAVARGEGMMVCGTAVIDGDATASGGAGVATGLQAAARVKMTTTARNGYWTLTISDCAIGFQAPGRRGTSLIVALCACGVTQAST